MRQLWVISILAFCFGAFADEVIPPAPTQYFNDYAHAVSSVTASQLNQTLEDFERQSSEQILVAIFPTMQSDSSIEDYTVRVARSWKAGQKDKNNGAVLFVFVKDHKIFLEVGYGLESVLPDALCKRIIDEQISPRFKAGDFDGGMTAGVQSILAATKGEYKGTGQTVADNQTSHHSIAPIGFILFIVIIIIFSRGSGIFLPWLLLSSSGSSRGWGSGGFSSGGGFSGGFSGGGGSFGGGGAGGSW